jgi:stage II sporulation protein R
MRKIIVFLFVLVLVVFISNPEKQLIIPNDSIRFRIVANSDDLIDQQAKLLIKRELIPILGKISLNVKDINDTRNNIEQNIELIESIVKKYTNHYEINFGMNYFPVKNYNNVVYKEGNYESLVINIGNAVGQNWWCVLFPPLCLLEASVNDLDKAEYDFYFKEIINKYF